MNLLKILLPPRYNYIACFLTFKCNLSCDYCINWFESNPKTTDQFISGEKLVNALNRIECAPDIPITLQGGEPSLHPDFLYIINTIKPELNIDILTNLQFDIKTFIREVKPARLTRNAPYANIRASYHPEQTDPDTFIEKIRRLLDAGFSIGGYGVLHPRFKEHILETQRKCSLLGIDFRTKEFLGIHKNILYGKYRYPDAVHQPIQQSCRCRTSELIIGPKGDIFQCHHDLYNQFPPLGNILDPDFEINDTFRDCSSYGQCNPCDIKVKTNRLQIDGHCSVEITDIKEMT